MANRNELGPIKYVQMVHSCSIDDIEYIVCDTLEIRQLKLVNNDHFYSHIGIVLLPEETHLSISANHLKYL